MASETSAIINLNGKSRRPKLRVRVTVPYVTMSEPLTAEKTHDVFASCLRISFRGYTDTLALGSIRNLTPLLRSIINKRCDLGQKSLATISVCFLSFPASNVHGFVQRFAFFPNLKWYQQIPDLGWDRERERFRCGVDDLARLIPELDRDRFRCDLARLADRVRLSLFRAAIRHFDSNMNCSCINVNFSSAFSSPR